jgi:hypothetical protein
METEKKEQCKTQGFRQQLAEPYLLIPKQISKWKKP